MWAWTRSARWCQIGRTLQLILLDAKGGFGLGELDIGLPELLIAPVGDVRAQQIGAFRERRPVVEGGVAVDVEAEARRAAVRLQCDREAGGGALVLLQDAADLPVHLRRIDRACFERAMRAARRVERRLRSAG